MCNENLVANCQIGCHFADSGKCKGLTKGSHDSAAVVQPAARQNDRPPDDVCRMIAALHFLVAL